MPAVVTDPSLQPGIVNQNTSIFDYPDTPVPSVMALQGSPSQPLADRTATATGLLLPDLLLEQRLANFPEEVWTVTPDSYIYRFMAALLGPAGAGQLRQRQQMARLQSAVEGTHFFDLDAFYGALFSAQRSNDAALPQNPSTQIMFNPYQDLATQDGWDDILALDAIYRERVIQLARAISLGGTVPGLQAIAEAIVRVPCAVYETWRLVDYQGPQPGLGNTWGAVQSANPLWSSFGSVTWAQVTGTSSFGGLGINARCEVVIQPQRSYAGDLASQQQAASDAAGIMAVTDVLAPASSIITVDTSGALSDMPVTIAGLSADSDYWEVIAKVQAPQGDPKYGGFVTAYDRGGQRVDSARPMKPGVPPFTQSQGVQYSYASSAAVAFASSWEPVTSGTAVLDAPKKDMRDYQTVHFPNGRTVSYVPAWGIADAATMAAGRASSAVSSAAAPYSGPRMPVTTAG